MAADAAELVVEVEYEELPPLVDPFKAMDANAPVLREDPGWARPPARTARESIDNHIFAWEVGDREATDLAFRDAEEVSIKELDLLSTRPSVAAGNLASASPRSTRSRAS